MNGLKKIIMIVLGCTSMMICAKVQQARSTAKLNIMLARSPYSIVMLYNKNRELMRDKSYRSKIQDSQALFRALSDDDSYKEADLQFIQADVSDRDLASFARKYNASDRPIFIIFIGRQPVGQPVSGFIYRDQLEQLVQRNLSQHLKQRMLEKRQARNIALKKQKFKPIAKWPIGAVLVSLLAVWLLAVLARTLFWISFLTHNGICINPKLKEVGMKMKKLFILLAFAVVLGSTVAEARRGGGGHRGGGRGFHRSFRHHGGWRGLRRGGLWGPGYGSWSWGPSFGVTVPVGGDSGPSRSSALKYAMKRYNNSGTSESFCNWVYGPYERDTARSLCNQYNAYMSGAGSTSSSPSGYVSFGLGGGYGGYGYPGWRRDWF